MLSGRLGKDVIIRRKRNKSLSVNEKGKTYFDLP